uniref:Phospholipase D3 n=1 Tax=Syphacia muris TaxID=451379 RepID=A0A158R5U2_9BILA
MVHEETEPDKFFDASSLCNIGKKIFHTDENVEKNHRFLKCLFIWQLYCKRPLCSIQNRKLNLKNCGSVRLAAVDFRLEIVESIPENVSFGDVQLPRSTFDAWKSLITESTDEILIAAYKSSLRGIHVFGSQPQSFSEKGDKIYDYLLNNGLKKKLNIKIVENFPPKDKGDNADAAGLAEKGVANRQLLNFKKIFGRGTMHSKFIVSDKKNFYLGSANLDWRSLNQKMELGVLVTSCPCLATDLANVFNSYWSIPHETNADYRRNQPKALFNIEKPLTIQVKGTPTSVYLATSPPQLNGPERTWDLHAITTTIDDAKSFLYIHVMDYFPMHIYTKPKRFWPIIDSAIRRAILRGVEVKLLAAALHYPRLGVRFLSSLQSLNGITDNGGISVKIFKVPTAVEAKTVLRRERRTHNKFLVTDNTVIIGTSNWSGDYFEGGSSGAALVIQQNNEYQTPIVDEMKNIFLRDWHSEYAHDLSKYIEKCITSFDQSFCETPKDPSLFASRPTV